ncbi:hypothetical protein R1flu_012638 [Riccia fluitans]|uniref:F-box domain-containing protein n=1 Tax=Riccia fluitans TaxID=41844 RepID=A0ABD1ZB68_9MARC
MGTAAAVGDDEEDASVVVDLPDELVDKIISKIPFPNIFKARLLNKNWNEKKFETIATTVCDEWPVLCPAFFDTENNSFLGYDAVESSWMTMELSPVQRTLKCLQRGRDSSMSEFKPSNPCLVNGVLVCEVDFPGSQVRIINLLTGRTRTIPYPPNFDGEDPSTADRSFYSSVVETDRNQVILYGIVKESHGLNRFDRHVFDFGSQSWSVRNTAAYFDCNCKHYAYLQGRMYFLCSTIGLWEGVAFHVGCVGFEDEHLLISQREIPLDLERVILSGVLRCGSRIIALVVLGEEEGDVAQLYEVNTRTLRVSPLSSGLLEGFTGFGDNSVASFPPNVIAHRNIIFFYGHSCLCSFDVESGDWQYHDIQFAEEFRRAGATVCPVAFEPGVNPLVIP